MIRAGAGLDSYATTDYSWIILKRAVQRPGPESDIPVIPGAGKGNVMARKYWRSVGVGPPIVKIHVTGS